MKFILSFFLYVIFLLPAFADVPSCEELSDTQCIQTSGCGWNGLDCAVCESGTYNNGSTSTCQSCENDPSYDQTTLNAQNKQHPRGASSCADWECISGYHLVNIAGIETCQLCDPAILPANAEFVNGNDASCAWQCEEGFYKNSTGTGCNECPNGSSSTPGAESISQCTCQSKNNGESGGPSSVQLLLIQITGNQYYCGQCGDGVITTANTNPVQCTCFHGANIVNGEQTVANNISVQCMCPSGTANIDTTTNTCQCGADHYLKNNNGTWTCAQCPSHSHHSTIGSEDVNDCICDATYPTRIYDENNKLIGCGQCPDSNSTYDSVANKCKCIKGYYNTSTSTEPNMVSCTACPLGMTTDNIGSNSANDCHMTSNTKFCYRDSNNNEHCMNLIPTGASSINGQNAN